MSDVTRESRLKKMLKRSSLLSIISVLLVAFLASGCATDQPPEGDRISLGALAPSVGPAVVSIPPGALESAKNSARWLQVDDLVGATVADASARLTNSKAGLNKDVKLVPLPSDQPQADAAVSLPRKDLIVTAVVVNSESNQIFFGVIPRENVAANKVASEAVADRHSLAAYTLGAQLVTLSNTPTSKQLLAVAEN